MAAALIPPLLHRTQARMTTQVSFTAACDRDGCSADAEWTQLIGTSMIDERGMPYHSAQYEVQCPRCGGS